MPKITSISYQKLIKIFQLDGFEIKRQKGDHISMTKPVSFGWDVMEICE